MSFVQGNQAECAQLLSRMATKCHQMASQRPNADKNKYRRRLVKHRRHRNDRAEREPTPTPIEEVPDGDSDEAFWKSNSDEDEIVRACPVTSKDTTCPDCVSVVSSGVMLVGVQRGKPQIQWPQWHLVNSRLLQVGGFDVCVCCCISSKLYVYDLIIFILKILIVPVQICSVMLPECVSLCHCSISFSLSIHFT